METLIDSVSSDSSLINRKDPYARITAILGRISECKREGKSLQDLLKVANEYDSIMATKSKEGTKVHLKNLQQAKKFRDFIDLFQKYQEAIAERGVYDYDDMILTVLKALNEEEWMLASVQEQFQYILVDEAQDLNGAQWAVVDRLTTYDVLPHEPNFFLVGDDDQAIYRFQGANMAHMLRFHERFPSAPIIVLTENYRSTQPILDSAGRLIAHNEERLIGKIDGLHKDLTAHTKEEGIQPILLRAASDIAQPWLIADIIEERLAAGIPADEIAVLVQTNGELRPIYDVLRARNIPTILFGKADLLTHPVVMQAMTILKCIGSSTDESFFTALACECFGCHPADIARIVSIARSEKKSSVDVLLTAENDELPLIDRAKLIESRDNLLDLRAKRDSRTVLQTVEDMLRRSGIGASAQSLDPFDLAVVESFFRYTKERSLNQPTLTFHAFLHDLSFYGNDQYSQVRLSYQIPHLVTSGVQLITAHQSKGLEFHTVILSDFSDGHWDQRKHRAELSLPEDLLFGYETDQKRFEKHQDERRVAYVAMTRAKRELIFVCPKEFSVGERTRAVSPSAFFAEAGSLPESEGVLKTPQESSLLLLHPKRDLDDELKAYIREKLETFALSPTSLSRYLNNPREFLYVDLLNQPEQFSEASLRALGYGSAVHWALNEWAVSVQKQLHFTVENFLEQFELHLRTKNILTEQQRSDLLAHGKEALPSYFESQLKDRHPLLYTVERSYHATLIDAKTLEPIPIKGKIDRIDLLSATSSDAIVIDYKTGRSHTPADIRGGLEAGKVSRTDDGRSFRQLVFYSILLEKAEPLLTPQSFSLEYIGENGEETISRQFMITEEEKDDLRGLIKEVWGRIQALDFEETHA